MPRFLERDDALVTDDAVAAEVIERVNDLTTDQSEQLMRRDRLRRIMDGGDGAIAALLGDEWAEATDGMPVANLMLSGMTRLAQKLGRRPDVKVDPPVSKDTDNARKRAERRARIVESYDADAKLDMKLPQLGRWLPGYGFCVTTVEHGRNRVDEPFPNVGIRDPFETFTGEWGVDQQPEDVAFLRMVKRDRLAKMYPQYADRIKANMAGLTATRSAWSVSNLSTGAQERWASRGKDTVEVYEYINVEGSWWVLPEAGLVLNFVRNPLSRRPPFYALKRFSFSKLTSQYEHVIGLMSSMARLNLLSIIAAEDSALAETNVVGELVGENYRQGRGSINFFTPGTSVTKMNSQVPFQVFTQIDRLERQARMVAGYPVTDDSISPNSFVTGRGLDELTSAVDREVREYFTIQGDALTELDAMRLEWDEKAYGSRSKTVAAIRDGAPFAETYRPNVAIKGDYRTRRIFGAMAGFDEPTKIITGLQLLQGEIIDVDTMREQIDGLENHTKIAERIRNDKVERILFDTMLQRAAQGDPQVLAAAIEMLPAGDMKTLLQGIFGPPEDAPSPEQAATQGGLEELFAGGGAPDTQTLLSRLTSGAGGRVTPTLGVQSVGQT